MFKNGERILKVLLIAQIVVDSSDAKSLLSSDELKTFNQFYDPLHDYINYFANILDAKKQPTIDKSIFFHITSSFSTGIVSLSSRYGILVCILLRIFSYHFILIFKQNLIVRRVQLNRLLCKIHTVIFS